jgi:hypothetical protein
MKTGSKDTSNSMDASSTSNRRGASCIRKQAIAGTATTAMTQETAGTPSTEDGLLQKRRRSNSKDDNSNSDIAS